MQVLKDVSSVGVITIVIILFIGILGFINITWERVLFKNSYQYQSARESAIATYEAQLHEIEYRLSTEDLALDIRNNLKAQASALRIQIEIERKKK